MSVAAMTIEAPSVAPLRPGSEGHRDLFCDVMTKTHDPYNPAMIAWPRLSPDALSRLTKLPFWDIAVQTEGFAAARVKTLADRLTDPVLREAVTLNAFEEGRHKLVLEHMLRFYEIPLGPEPPYTVTADPEWAFLRTGYGECFDSFFAFGLFELARRSGFFPPELVSVFEPVVREESRHILFFVNWVSYTAARKPLGPRLLFRARCLQALAVSAASRLSLGKGFSSTTEKAKTNDNFVIESRGTLSDSFSITGFLELCLEENDRRLSGFDPRLKKPRLMPTLVKAALFILRLREKWIGKAA